MIAYRYLANSFSQEKFVASGAMVAVVMNYNKRGMVSRAVESAFAQDWPCYEILALDDASSDGSEQEMLETVKREVAAHSDKAVKITVAINESNLTILGQWRKAIELSNGNWFGMFAADDVSLPDRMRISNRVIGNYPMAAGICTNFTRTENGKVNCAPGVYVKIADCLLWPDQETMRGCTAFWHRRLLSQNIPDGNMDDFMLTWICAIAKAGDLVWDMDETTVQYSTDTGVTTEDRKGVDDNALSVGAIYSKYKAIVKRGRHFGRKVWDVIKGYNDQYGKDNAVGRQVRGHWIASWTEGGNWFDRLKALWTMLVVDYGNDYGGYRRPLVAKVVRRFATRFLGPVSFVPALYLSSKLAANR